MERVDLNFRGCGSFEDIRNKLLEKAQELGIQDTHEVERKWLISPELIPWLANPVHRAQLLKEFFLERIYLTTDPELRFHSARPVNLPAKKEFTSYRIGTKSSGDLDRIEIEYELPYNSRYFSTETLIDLIDKIDPTVMVEPITKRYWAFSYNGIIYELNSVDNGTFFYMEVEFADTEIAKEFELPAEIAVHALTEVTSNPEWKMKNYWKSTRVGGVSITKYRENYEKYLPAPIPEDLRKAVRDQVFGASKRRTEQFEQFVLSNILDMAQFIGYRSNTPAASAKNYAEMMDELPTLYSPPAGILELPAEELEFKYKQYLRTLHTANLREGLSLLGAFIPHCMASNDVNEHDALKALAEFALERQKSSAENNHE